MTWKRKNTQRKKKGKRRGGIREKVEKSVEGNRSTGGREEIPYWRPTVKTSKVSKQVRRQEEAGKLRQKRKWTRRLWEANKEKHSGGIHDVTSSYKNMYDNVN